MFKSPTYTTCVISYTADIIIPNPILKRIATIIVEQATYIWIQGNDSCINESYNMNALKSHLTEVGESELLQWLEPFENLDMDNRYADASMAGFCFKLF